jgi:heme/copper-type cytochrome/quinol oxidase subunit 2
MTMTLTTVLTLMITIAFTIVDIHNITDTTKNAVDNKKKNEKKLMAIWQAMPSRPRVMIVLGIATYSTVHTLQVYYKLFRSREKVIDKQISSSYQGRGQDVERKKN